MEVFLHDVSEMEDIGMEDHLHVVSDGDQIGASKTDTQAVGCARSWGCVCDGHWTKPCGYHSMKFQITFVRNAFGANGLVPSGFPLFPNESGEFCTKNAVVHTIEQVALRLGLPIKDEDGSNLYGGHTLRVSAAQHLARLGIALPIIMLLARWESQAVMGYVSEAPLATITRDYKNKEASEDLTNKISA